MHAARTNRITAPIRHSAVKYKATFIFCFCFVSYLARTNTTKWSPASRGWPTTAGRSALVARCYILLPMASCLMAHAVHHVLCSSSILNKIGACEWLLQSLHTTRGCASEFPLAWAAKCCIRRLASAVGGVRPTRLMPCMRAIATTPLCSHDWERGSRRHSCGCSIVPGGANAKLAACPCMRACVCMCAHHRERQ